MIISLENIIKKYDAPVGFEAVSVLNGINLQIDKGQSVAIVGPSGSGKSTLLNIIGGLDYPTSGSVYFDDQKISDLTENQRAKIRNQGIGFVFQQHYLLPQLTVLENVLIPTLVKKENEKNVNERARYLLDRVGIAGRTHYRPAQISGGEQQRTAVVRALINQPQVLLADEPTGSLDQDASGQLGDLLVELNKEENIALIVVTHSTELARRMDSVYQLKSGFLKNENP